MVENFIASGTLPLVDGYSHAHSFYVNAPYKIHKLSMEQISEKTKPPTRMVISAVGGPTYR